MRSGYWKENLSGDAVYRSFVPSALPPEPAISPDGYSFELLLEANKSLAALEGLSSYIPNVNLFIAMYVRKEALLSSQIEGTQVTLEDILDPMVEENTNRDVAEVVNYIMATEYAVKRLTELPLCIRLICETHAVLMQGVRGETKMPGELRKSQNWIGGGGSTIQNARYIPPSPEDMQVALNELENYINREAAPGELNLLIKAALIHYQFETIHPFLDGNGRIGRLLVILFLIEKGALSAPVLYISYSLKLNRAEYYDRLTLVREQGDYEQWVRFFLTSILESANDAVETIGKFYRLRESNLPRVEGLGRSAKTATALFSYLEENPIIDIKKTAAALEMSYNTVAGAVEKLCDLGILRQTDGARRNRTFIYSEYVEILKKGT